RSLRPGFESQRGRPPGGAWLSVALPLQVNQPRSCSHHAGPNRRALPAESLSLAVAWPKFLTRGAARFSVRVEMGTAAAVPADGARCVTVNNRRYALFKVGEKVYCLDNTCTHLGGPLCEGDLDGF